MEPDAQAGTLPVPANSGAFGNMRKEKVVSLSTEVEQLDLVRLHEGYPSLTPASGARLGYVAAICLEERRHRRGVMMEVSGSFSVTFSLQWSKTTDQMRREFSDPDEATEDGACGIAILLVGQLTEFQIVRRSWKGPGFDYWLGKKTDTLLQNAARLEVSGIRSGDAKNIQARCRQKVEQTKKSDSLRLPAFIVIVEFGGPAAVMVSR